MNIPCYVFLMLIPTLTQNWFFNTNNYQKRASIPILCRIQEQYMLDVTSLEATLPVAREMPSYIRGSSESTKFNETDHKELYQKGARYYGDFIGWRGNEGTYHFRVEVTLYDSQVTANKTISEAMQYMLASGEVQEHSHTGKKIGTKVWSSNTGSLLVILDGRATVIVKVGPFVLRDKVGNILYDAEGTPLFYRPTWEDKQFAEKLAVDTLNRLTVLGVTSKPTNKASLRAKQQVAERYEALLKKQKGKKPRTTGSVSTGQP
jgi:hypothetical protein